MCRRRTFTESSLSQATSLSPERQRRVEVSPVADAPGSDVKVCDAGWLLRLQHLEHVAACLGAVAALLGALRHRLVIGELLARRGAVLAGLGARLDLVHRERALSPAQRRTQRTDVATVGTRPGG